MIGLEVETIEDKGKLLAPFSIAYVSRLNNIPTPTPARLHGRYRLG